MHETVICTLSRYNDVNYPYNFNILSLHFYISIFYARSPSLSPRLSFSDNDKSREADNGECGPVTFSRHTPYTRILPRARTN